MTALNSLFNIKEWHSLADEKGARYLGAVWHQSSDGQTIVMDMSEYIAAIERPQLLMARVPVAHAPA
jgi:hypothetical protein